ncbi:glutamate--cysteine ligase [Vibrio viridaestus]|uniref:Glutamate--cysteine ligase n=1 Tax=Vibrio viridaestus TaxID=2487322 RepID=A0A3N9TFC0_9VIBR|nr:glutamate--cysteine ligase [Vibrio viridaestus]RQW62937.1 glutamate--cysteine ligase [Vibrio viridaestus]
MTNFAQRLEQIAQNPEILKSLGRGIERETLRYQDKGRLAKTPHPEGLGSALKNGLITTDFAESLLEFITPVNTDVSTLLNQLTDIHHFTKQKLGEERLWPMSMPCFVDKEDDIQLAQYGTSNSGRMKTLYREGLKRRYGSLMQIISGVHFNFSFPETFWDVLFGQQNEQERQDSKSDAYFGLIRNYYRFGWLIPYLFGASPAICSSFLQGKKSSLPFESVGKTLYLPYATSLRLSDLGYTNNAQSNLKIQFNSLDQYLDGLSRAIRTPSDVFAKIGVKVDGEYRQLNSNVLQIENELYAPIRPKRVTKSGEKPSDALARGGVEYIEVRSLDVNPFSPVGINETQVRFLDLFLVWAALTESDPMGNCELECWRDNWRKVIVEGRKPGLELQIGCRGEVLQLTEWASRVFSELKQVAQVMDSAQGSDQYTQVADELAEWIIHPEKTLSAQMLDRVKEEGGIGAVGLSLNELHEEFHRQYDLRYYSQEQLENEAADSVKAQRDLEASDHLDFDRFLEEYFSYLQKDEVA